MKLYPLRLLPLWLLALCGLAQPLCADGVGESRIDGFTEPYRTINVAALEPGVITELHVQEGQKVRKGQLLATLDSNSLEASREVAKAGRDALGRIHSAEALLQLKTERLGNLRALRAQGHAHQEEVRRAESDVRVAEAELLAAKEDQVARAREYSRIEVQLERRKIRSPMDGIVTRLQKQIGEYVPSSDTSVLTLVELDRLLVVFPVPRKLALRYRAGDTAAVSFVDGQKPTLGTVEAVSLVTDPESDTVRMRVVIDNSRLRHTSGVACWLGDAPSVTQRTP